MISVIGPRGKHASKGRELKALRERGEGEPMKEAELLEGEGERRCFLCERDEVSTKPSCCLRVWRSGLAVVPSSISG